MIIVDVNKSGGLEKALRKWKRKFDRTKTMKELRKRREFTKKSVKRREEIKKAVYKDKNGLS